MLLKRSIFIILVLMFPANTHAVEIVETSGRVYEIPGDEDAIELRDGYRKDTSDDSITTEGYGHTISLSIIESINGDPVDVFLERKKTGVDDRGPHYVKPLEGYRHHAYAYLESKKAIAEERFDDVIKLAQGVLEAERKILRKNHVNMHNLRQTLQMTALRGQARLLKGEYDAALKDFNFLLMMKIALLSRPNQLAELDGLMDWSLISELKAAAEKKDSSSEGLSNVLVSDEAFFVYNYPRDPEAFRHQHSHQWGSEKATDALKTVLDDKRLNSYSEYYAVQRFYRDGVAGDEGSIEKSVFNEAAGLALARSLPLETYKQIADLFNTYSEEERKAYPYSLLQFEFDVLYENMDFAVRAKSYDDKMAMYQRMLEIPLFNADQIGRRLKSFDYSKRSKMDNENRTISIEDQVAMMELIKSKNWSEALTFANQLIENNPKDPNGVYYRGLVYYSQGKIEEALQDLDQSIQMAATEMPRAHELRAKIYHDQGRYEEAKAEIQKSSGAGFAAGAVNIPLFSATSSMAMGDREAAVEEIKAAEESMNVLKALFGASSSSDPVMGTLIEDHKQKIQEIKAQLNLDEESSSEVKSKPVSHQSGERHMDGLVDIYSTEGQLLHDFVQITEETDEKIVFDFYGTSVTYYKDEIVIKKSKSVGE